MKPTLARIISESSLWHLGKDSHNALSELVESLADYMKGRGKDERESI